MDLAELCDDVRFFPVPFQKLVEMATGISLPDIHRSPGNWLASGRPHTRGDKTRLALHAFGNIRARREMRCPGHVKRTKYRLLGHPWRSLVILRHNQL